jgi:hypothetical protein
MPREANAMSHGMKRAIMTAIAGNKAGQNRANLTFRSKLKAKGMAITAKSTER